MEASTILLQLANWTKARRHKLNLSYAKLRASSGLPVGTLHAIEHATNSPTLETLEKLCRGLGCTPETFFSSLRKRNSKND